MSTIDLKVIIQDARDAADEAAGLEDWLRLARIDGLRASRQRQTVRAGEMGGELLPILSIVLSSTVLAETIKAVHGWLTGRRRRVVVELDLPGGRFRVESDGGETVESLLGKIQPLLATAPADPPP